MTAAVYRISSAALLMVACFPASSAAITYNVSLPTANFGWLDQYSLDSLGYPGNEACVPTSSTNAMTYLQNTYAGYFGAGGLTGSTYASWENTAEILTGAAYMNTTSGNGTDFDHVPYALNKYIVEDLGFSAVQFGAMMPSNFWGSAPYDKPGYAIDGLPTSAYLLSALESGSAIVFGIAYDGGGGHGLLATGLDWNDANNDGIIQQSEGAMLSFVDPLDPADYDGSGQPDSGPKLTTGSIYYDSEAGGLILDYLQYWGSLPYEDTDYGQVNGSLVNAMFTLNVPEPGTWAALAGALVLGLTVLTRRRRA